MTLDQPTLDQPTLDQPTLDQLTLDQLTLDRLRPGDLVYAAAAISNDGGIPGLAADALIAPPGTRGVILKIGHLEEDPERTLYLVRFEGPDLVLGPPTGCWAEELSTTQATTQVKSVKTPV